ncbi:MAG: SPFH domain-containing protein [bacterium]|nr:SPFH domain-containing protein [bacterium]
MIKENLKPQFNGWGFLFLFLILAAISIYGIVQGGIMVYEYYDYGLWVLIGSIVGLLFCVAMLTGLFTVEPNEARVLILFGKYVGTEKTTGFRWANPLLSKKRISLRARNFDGEKLKVNDKKGNPIEISAVVVWRVQETAQAVFEVDNYIDYVRVQSESALRHLATSYPYDLSNEDDESVKDELSLRSSLDEVNEALRKEIQDRVISAGVYVEETRINHLAYAPEIAQAMLQRQQAEAIIAARKKIVDGAVSMVEMALIKLKENEIMELDEEKKATMVSNLLVVLCGDKAVNPIINAGTIY